LHRQGRVGSPPLPSWLAREARRNRGTNQVKEGTRLLRSGRWCTSGLATVQLPTSARGSGVSTRKGSLAIPSLAARQDDPGALGLPPHLDGNVPLGRVMRPPSQQAPVHFAHAAHVSEHGCGVGRCQDGYALPFHEAQALHPPSPTPHTRAGWALLCMLFRGSPAHDGIDCSPHTRQ